MTTGIRAIAVLLAALGFAAADEYRPASPPPEATAINRSLLKNIEDDAPVRNKFENRDEAFAYDYIVNFARRVPDASFRSHAQKELTFAHLLGAEAFKYRGDVALVEGRLKRVRDIKPTATLEADGVKNLYEAWIFSEVYREHAWCVLFTDLPPDIPVAEELDRSVSFAGYFYKIYRYPTPDGTRRSPLLVGRTIATKAQAATGPSIWELSGRSIPLLIGSIGGAIGTLVALTYWFRRSDRSTRAAIEQARGIVGGNSHGAI